MVKSKTVSIAADDRLLTREQVLEILQVGKSTLARMEVHEGFPRPIALSGRSVRYRQSAINVWMQSRTHVPSSQRTGRRARALAEDGVC